MNKRVGIVTFHDHENYGAALQAYGLMKALERLGADVCFISDKRQEAGMSSEEAVGEPKYDRAAAVAKKMMLHYLQLRKKEFERFVEKYLPEVVLTGDTDLNREFSCFIAGSDQIWNYEITGKNPFWFLDFVERQKRVSYAASFGMDNLPERVIPWYAENLKDFRSLSVREASGVDIIRKLVGKEAQICPDPTLLLNYREWEKLVHTSQEAVVLYMTEFDSELYKSTQERARELGCPFICISTMLSIQSMSTQAGGCGPEEWLSCIYHAKEVYTNSFHGVVFSVLFHKELFVKPLQKLAQRNNRISNFLHILGVEYRESKEMQASKVVFKNGWEDVDKRIEDMREKGIKYLKSVL